MDRIAIIRFVGGKVIGQNNTGQIMHGGLYNGLTTEKIKGLSYSSLTKMVSMINLILMIITVPCVCSDVAW